MALYKVSTDVIAEQVSVERLLRENGARAVVIRKDYTVFETTGHREETDALIKILQPYGLIEFVRSARVAIIKNSDGFNSKLREFERLEPGEDVIENEYSEPGAKGIYNVSTPPCHCEVRSNRTQAERISIVRDCFVPRNDK
jgi:acetolactate synthase-1/3 small subunit